MLRFRYICCWDILRYNNISKLRGYLFREFGYRKVSTFREIIGVDYIVLGTRNKRDKTVFFANFCIEKLVLFGG